MKWNTALYDDKHNFVFKFGEDVVQLLAPKEGERILDVGCGTGYLTNLIAESGAEVVGIDNSVSMIEKAKAAYPAIDFMVMSATDIQFDTAFDAIFSNAVLHWVTDKEKAIRCFFNNLKPGGRFVAEFGGKDNVKNIVDALKQVLTAHGHIQSAALNFWYFPSVAEYTTLLEKQGFVVDFVTYFKRDTLLQDNDNGIKDWVRMFGSSFLKGIEETEVETILSEVQDIIRESNYREHKWYADYRRLRVAATKP